MKLGYRNTILKGARVREAKQEKPIKRGQSFNLKLSNKVSIFFYCFGSLMFHQIDNYKKLYERFKKSGRRL